MYKMTNFLGTFFSIYFLFNLIYSTLFSLDSQGGVYKQSGFTLAGIDCEVFVIHCTCPAMQMQLWASSDGKGSTRNWTGAFRTRVKDLNYCAMLLHI